MTGFDHSADVYYSLRVRMLGDFAEFSSWSQRTMTDAVSDSRWVGECSWHCGPREVDAPSLIDPSSRRFPNAKCPSQCEPRSSQPGQTTLSVP